VRSSPVRLVVSLCLTFHAFHACFIVLAFLSVTVEGISGTSPGRPAFALTAQPSIDRAKECSA